MTFDHVGIVVSTLAAGREQLTPTLHIKNWTLEYDDFLNKVSVQFGRDPAGICYELIAPLGEGSPSARAAKTNRDILNHVAYLVDDLAAAAASLRKVGGTPITTSKPAIAFGGKSIQFFLTRSKFVLELIEAPVHRHYYLAGEREDGTA